MTAMRRPPPNRLLCPSADMRPQPSSVGGLRRLGRPEIDEANPTTEECETKIAALLEATRGDACYLARSGSADPLSGSPAFSVRDCEASPRILARIGSNGPNLCCSGLNSSA